MIGQSYKNKPCGSFGDVSTFSFYPNKHITTGEGGMILTDNQDIAEECRSLRNLCFQKDNRFIHEKMGWNSRMSNIQAALGLAQLEKLSQSISIKREIGNFYNSFLRKYDFLQLPLVKTSYALNIYWVYGIVIDEKFSDAKSLINLLSKEGIGTRPFFYPMHKQPVFKSMGFFNGDVFPIAENLYKQGFYIPSGLGMNEQQLKRVKKTLIKIFG